MLRYRKTWRCLRIDKRFVIAGSGAEEANLKQQARELQVESWIEFAGWTDGKAKERYLKDSQALVLL